MTDGVRRRIGRRILIYVAAVVLVLLAILSFVIVRPNGAEAVFNEVEDQRFALEPVVDGLESPTDVATANDGSGRLLVVERAGRVRMVEGSGALLSAPVLDLSDQVDTEGEGGMLAIAFHPDSSTQDADSARFYLTWTTSDAVLTLGEFTLSRDATIAEPEHRVILEIPQPSHDHNGGDLAFGPDGLLYMSVGDGSLAGQQGLEAQSLSHLVGKILRLDVDRDTGSDQPYSIPPDNPFLADPNARPEIFALGLRNPWRIAFYEGELWAGDVGGAAQEEVNVIQRGGNYGWPLYEGNGFKFAGAVRHVVLEGRIFEYIPAVLRMNLSEDLRRIPPVAAYEHVGSAAVTGGLVVEEAAGLPSITGHYLFADFSQGAIWALDPNRDPVVVTTLMTNSGPIVSFGEGPRGDVLVVSLSGTISRLVESG